MPKYEGNNEQDGETQMGCDQSVHLNLATLYPDRGRMELERPLLRLLSRGGLDLDGPRHLIVKLDDDIVELLGRLVLHLKRLSMDDKNMNLCF